MFARDHRLDRAAFTTTYTHGKKLHMPAMVFIYAPAPTQKIAVVVGKKVAKSAMARNHLKRRLHGALSEADLHRGHVIVIAKPRALAYSYAQLQAEIGTALERALGIPPHLR